MKKKVAGSAQLISGGGKHKEKTSLTKEQKELNFYNRKIKKIKPECPVCHKNIYAFSEDIVYVKSAHGNENFYHKKCVLEKSN